MTKLRCVACKGSLILRHTLGKYSQYSSVNAELFCPSCSMTYPVVQDVPVMFKDTNRIKILIDSTAYEGHLRRVKETMKAASQVAGDELEQFKEKNNLSDALSWEILFWEKWKENEEGFLEGDKEKIDEYLKNDSEGGGRLKFLNKVKYFNSDILTKCLLNIGAGRDYLLERFLETGCQVVEQDIVLEPLLHLKKRGASFCVCCDARILPFEDNTFDISTAFSVLHHIWPIEVPVRELLRVTKGNVHFNEPNYFALTRVGLLMPNSIKHRLKKFYSGDGSHSPYEKSINPYLFKQIVSKTGGRCTNLSLQKDSWIGKSGILKKSLWAINIILVHVMPLVSAHFDAVISKSNKKPATIANCALTGRG